MVMAINPNNEKSVRHTHKRIQMRTEQIIEMKRKNGIESTMKCIE